ncbi:hypothetical protein ACEQPO_08955 [Bacillus sp. SL00103]
MEYGADYFISQPVYSEEQLVKIHEESRHLDKPIYIGIMPLTSREMREFIHHEIPGIKLSDSIRDIMARAGEDKEKAMSRRLSDCPLFIRYSLRIV